MVDPLVASLLPYARTALATDLSYIPDDVPDVSKGQSGTMKFRPEHAIQALGLIMPPAALRDFGDAYFAQDDEARAPDLALLLNTHVVGLTAPLVDLSPPPDDALDLARDRSAPGALAKLLPMEELAAARIASEDPAIVLTFASLSAAFVSHMHAFKQAMAVEAAAQHHTVPEKLERLHSMLDLIFGHISIVNMVRGPLSHACLIRERDIRAGKAHDGFTAENFSEIAAFLTDTGVFRQGARLCSFTRWFGAAAGSITGSSPRPEIRNDGARLFAVYDALRGSQNGRIQRLSQRVGREIGEAIKELRFTLDDRGQDMPGWLNSYEGPQRPRLGGHAAQDSAAILAKN